jgi:hypothetical protein
MSTEMIALIIPLGILLALLVSILTEGRPRG